MNLKQFFTGNAFDAHRYFGAHRQGDEYIIRTYAPNARLVAVIGDFTGWKEKPLHGRGNGVWEGCFASAHPGQRYKYRIYGSEHCREHCDPYGFGMELRPGNCTVLREMDGFSFTDRRWMRSRSRNMEKPMHIYELHFGSWMKNGWQWHSYESIAPLLIDYLTKHGFTHVEFMPLAEHPYDGSWGYQCTGFFAPTSRYGTAEQLKQLIDRLHNAGIGVILDFVPAHFAVDAYGLAKYDGTAMYELETPSEWGSWCFNHSSGTVASFLKSCAHYWLKEYHFDGLRIDAVSRMIYHGGDASQGENKSGQQFLRELNQGLRKRHPNAMLIAEDSTAWPGVTQSPEDGGLGFDYKWNMGWMYDTLKYMEANPAERRNLRGQFEFSIHYAWNERYILSFSHDEVAPGRRSILERLPGNREEKLAQARLLYLYMMSHPGKKLNFMGNEFATPREWDVWRELDWNTLSQPEHERFACYFQELSRLYLRKKPLWKRDCFGDGFLWLNCRCNNPCVFGYARRDADRQMILLLNFSDQEAQIDLDWFGSMRVLLHTDWVCFGGNSGRRGLKKKPDTLPPFSGVLLEAL